MTMMFDRLMLAAALFFAFGAPLAQARDDGRYANSPLKQWFDSLKSGKGPCCSDADGSAVSDVDWESKGGHYRVRIDGEWARRSRGCRHHRAEPGRAHHGLADFELRARLHVDLADARVVLLRDGVVEVLLDDLFGDLQVVRREESFCETMRFRVGHVVSFRYFDPREMPSAS